MSKLLTWTDSDFAIGPSGTRYSIWSESYAGRHGDRQYKLQKMEGSQWVDVPDSMRSSKRDVKRFAERMEQKQ